MKPKDLFIELLGKEALSYIEENNWVSFEKRNLEIYQRNEILINFLEKDTKGDKVSFMQLCYNIDNKKWFTENCIDVFEIMCDTYTEMKKHLSTIEDQIINAGFSLAELP